MGLADKSFDSIVEDDLYQLIADGVPEGARIEYKRETYGSADQDKREFLKDVTSLANSFGGHLVLGLDESGGVASAITPIRGDADQELLRLESLARDGVEPRINGLRMRWLPIAGGGYAVVIRVPRSWNSPHRVSFKGAMRFYGRTSAGAYELSVEELRDKFNSSATAVERAVALRQRRLALISSGEGVVPIDQVRGYVVVHVVPLGGVGVSVDLERALTDASELLRPLGRDGWSSEFNFDGFANLRSGQPSPGYTQLFRDGVVEATRSGVTASSGPRRIPAQGVGDPIVRGVNSYAAALSLLGVPAPLSIMITLVGVRGAFLGYAQSQSYEPTPALRQDVLELPPGVLEEYRTDNVYDSVLRPAFDALWNAGGLSRSTYFDEAGRWRPHS